MIEMEVMTWSLAYQDIMKPSLQSSLGPLFAALLSLHVTLLGRR
jgi:hypothetical protein